MTRRDWLLQMAATVLAALAPIRAIAAARPFDALCDEQGVPLSTEGGDWLLCG